MIIIKRVRNGVWVDWLAGEEENIQEVYEFDAGEIDSGIERFRDLLYDLTQEFGFNTNRYNRERIAIKIESGDKYMLQSDEKLETEKIYRVKKKKK